MKTITVNQRASSFAEDKDVAAEIRESDLRPTLRDGKKLRLDFRGVEGATQSFVHAMISDLIRREGPAVLDRIEFKNCNASVRSVIEIVVEYSQLGDNDSA